MKKIIKLITSLLIICWLVYSCVYSKEYLITLKETTYLWFTIIIPSILPMYVIGNLLLCNRGVFRPLFILTNNYLHFENELSCLIFWISILIGNPTTSSLIIDSVDKGQISNQEANRLMRATSHLSPIFIWIISGELISFLILFFSLIIASVIILHLSKNEVKTTTLIQNTSYFQTINKIIDNGPMVLLKILLIMIMINFFKTFCLSFCPTSILNYLLYLFSLLEITLGTSFINSQTLPLLGKLLWLGILLSTTCLSLILQVINCCNNRLNINNYLKFRFIHLALTVLLITFAYLIFI